MLSVIEKVKNKFFSNFVSYYNGDKFELKQSQNQKPKANKQCKILIVSPSYYTQTEKKYPITDRKELKKLLKLQRSSGQFYLMKDHDEHGIRVAHWVFNENLPKAWLYIPESLVLEYESVNNEIMEISETEDSSYFFGRDQNRTFVAQKSSIMNTPERFSMSTGVQYTAVNRLDFAQKLAILLPAISNLKVKDWFAFVPQTDQVNWWPLLIKSVLPASVVLLTYTLVSSIYLFSVNAHYNSTLNQQSGDMNALLDLQQKIDESKTANAQLQAFLEDKQGYLALWLELAPLFELVDIDSIRISNQRIQIRGEADKATRILELLTNSPNVAEAKFDSPVSKTRRAERFIVSFTLTNTIVLEPKLSPPVSKEGG
jgi:hypothetical protein